MKTIKVSDEEYNKIKDLIPESKPIEEMADIIGKTLSFWCARYIYHGTVVAVNSDFITLDNAQIIYDTGSLDKSEPETAEKLMNGCQVMRSAIESFMELGY